MMRTIGVRAATVGLIVLAAWAIGQAEEVNPDRQQLAFRAEGLLLSRCAVCHSTDLVTQQRLDRGRWETTIKKMIHWGAEVSQEETVMLADYLSARYHPDVPDQEPAGQREAVELLRVETNAATGRPAGETAHGEVVYAHNCQACHGAGATGGVGPRLAGNPILGDEDHFWETVLHGRGAMPAWESALSVQEIADVRAWLQTIR